MPNGNSYGVILRSSSIMGGAQAVNYLAGLARVKVAALLLGPSGVGVVGLYIATTSLIRTVTGLGIQSSGVRAVAAAHADGDSETLLLTARTLRRMCWLTGALGWIACVALAAPLSRWMFQSTAHTYALAALGAMLLLNAVSGGQTALLQGLRRIEDLARVQIGAATINTVITAALYWWLAADGIVPVLVVTAAVSSGLSWWFARTIPSASGQLGLRQTFAEARPLIELGVALMWSALIGTALDLLTRSLITRQLGLDAAGLYQAAWALSGMFAGFILSAMGTDFYPRLTATIGDRKQASRAINEQTEIGILLALPGLLTTLALASWVIWLFYSSEFAPAADLLAWMVLGVFGRTVSWPLGYVQLAIGAARWYMITEAFFGALHAAMLLLFVPRWGLLGAAYAFAGLYGFYMFGARLVAGRLIGFQWSTDVIRMMIIATCFVAAGLIANRLLDNTGAAVIGGTLAITGTIWSAYGLLRRLQPNSRLAVVIRRVLPRSDDRHKPGP